MYSFRLRPVALVAAALGLCASVVTVAVAAGTDARAARPRPTPLAERTVTPPPGTPPLTAAPVTTTTLRQPTTTTTAAAPATPMTSALDRLLVNTNSCVEVRSASGALLYSHQPSAALAPASTQKLLVAAAALDVLGPEYRFVTSVVASRRPVNGEVDDLWLVGGGDPVLSSPEYTGFLMTEPITGGRPVTTQLVALVTQLAAAGVKAVPGGIHGDDSRYDRTRFLPTWKAVYQTEGDVAPLGALEVDDGLDHWRPAVLTADPAGHAAGVLARIASGAGITAAQAPDSTSPAGGVVLAAVQSPPLADIVASMLRDSDNTAAEMLTRELDRVSGGAGTTAGGLAVVARELAKLGVPTSGLHLIDGSGLSPDDRATCDTLLDTLQLSLQTRFAPLGMLSVAGRFGTLIHRFLGTPAVGRVAAKTGSIGGVMGLVGSMDEGSPIRFAFLLNGAFSYSVGAGYEDRLVALLGTYRG